jgi:hypothetical protein
MALQYQEVELEINYNDCISKVYSNVARYIIQESKHLEILLHCVRESNSHNALPLPS